MHENKDQKKYDGKKSNGMRHMVQHIYIMATKCQPTPRLNEEKKTDLECEMQQNTDMAE